MDSYPGVKLMEELKSRNDIVLGGLTCHHAAEILILDPAS